MDHSASRHERLQRNAEMHARDADAIRAAHESAVRSRRKRWMIVGVISVLVVLALGVRLVFAPGQYDGFAKCLTGAGAIMYGAIDWCSYTKAQANMFGKSYKYIDYRDYEEIDGISKTPTWVIGGERYPGVQGFERLSQLTGCKY